MLENIRLSLQGLWSHKMRSFTWSDPHIPRCAALLYSQYTPYTGNMRHWDFPLRKRCCCPLDTGKSLLFRPQNSARFPRNWHIPSVLLLFPQAAVHLKTAYIENTEGLRNGEYVDLTMSNTQESDGIYLDKAYVREEDGRKYVLKADENDLLVKQYIQTGKTIWGQAVEVLSGLTMEDRVAFPYGKTAKEGVKVTEPE